MITDLYLGGGINQLTALIRSLAAEIRLMPFQVSLSLSFSLSFVVKYYVPLYICGTMCSRLVGAERALSPRSLAWPDRSLYVLRAAARPHYRAHPIP